MFQWVGKKKDNKCSYFNVVGIICIIWNIVNQIWTLQEVNIAIDSVYWTNFKTHAYFARLQSMNNYMIIWSSEYMLPNLQMNYISIYVWFVFYSIRIDQPQLNNRNTLNPKNRFAIQRQDVCQGKVGQKGWSPATKQQKYI